MSGQVEVFKERLQKLILEAQALEARLIAARQLFLAAAITNDTPQMDLQKQTMLSLTEQVCDNIAMTQMITRVVLRDLG